MSNNREMMASAGDIVKNITIDYKIGKSKYMCCGKLYVEYVSIVTFGCRATNRYRAMEAGCE